MIFKNLKISRSGSTQSKIAVRKVAYGFAALAADRRVEVRATHLACMRDSREPATSGQATNFGRLWIGCIEDDF